HVAPDHGREPDRGPGAEPDAADDARAGRDERARVEVELLEQGVGRACHQMTFASSTRSADSNRSSARLATSTRGRAPETRSPITMPTAGECMKPWPENPFAR